MKTVFKKQVHTHGRRPSRARNMGTGEKTLPHQTPGQNPDPKRKKLNALAGSVMQGYSDADSAATISSNDSDAPTKSHATAWSSSTADVAMKHLGLSDKQAAKPER